MIITVDTNVLYQALNSRNGASFHILQLIRAGHFRMAVSNSTFCEYEDVLTRPTSLKAFELTEEDVIKFLKYIAFMSEKFDPYFLFRPNLKQYFGQFLQSQGKLTKHRKNWRKM